MLKRSLLTMVAVIGLASAVLPLLLATHAEAQACAAPPCGGGPPPPDGGGPPPPGDSGKPSPDLPDDPNFNADGSRKVEMLISCKLPKGEETRTVLFRNVGQKLIPSGTPVTWYVKTTGQGGKFSLPHELAVGAELTAADLLKPGVPGNTSCRSKL